jgi:hypothetical protein
MLPEKQAKHKQARFCGAAKTTDFQHVNDSIFRQ